MNNDPAVWLPVMLNQAERLSSNFKALVAKIGNYWTKKDQIGETDSRSSVQQNLSEEEKLKVASCCRKLRKAIANNRFKMKLLEKKLITNYTEKYKNAADLEIDAHSASEQPSADSPTHGKRLVVKIKNFREGKRRNSYYAEIDDAGKSSDEKSSHKSLDSGSSISTVPVSKSQSSDLNEEQHSALKVAEVSTPAEVMQENYDEIILALSFDGKEGEEETLAPAEQEDSQNIGSRDIRENAAVCEVKKEPLSPERNSKNPDATPGGVRKTSTPADKSNSSAKNGNQNEASPDRCHTSAVSKLKFHSSPNLERLNESIRQGLLKDSEESDDSLPDLTSSPRVKKTRMRNRSVPAGLNDPKLTAECAVVLSRLPDEVGVLTNVFYSKSCYTTNSCFTTGRRRTFSKQ